MRISKPKQPKKGIEIDPRDPNAELWQWILAKSQQQPAIRAIHSRIAKQRSDEYWEDHSAALTAKHREVREAWLTDKEELLTSKPPED